MSNVEIQRVFHDNGQIRSEVTLVNGLVNGVTKAWHKNGRLARETPVKDHLGDGVARQWNDKGELLGSYELHNGTGVFKLWYDNGQVQAEIDLVGGVRHGRTVMWFESGEPIGSTFWIKGKQVSFKKYREACKKDPTLKIYEKPSPTLLENEVKEERRRGSPQKRRTEDEIERMRIDQGAFVRALLDKPNRAEALAWLTASKVDSIRTLGELPSNQDSLEFVREIYAAGAAEVIAVEINSSPEGQNTGMLVITCPKEPKLRRRLFKWYEKQSKNMGFDPHPDYGQQYLFVMID